jgi:hypothetical protein
MISRTQIRYLSGMSSGLGGNSFLMQPGDEIRRIQRCMRACKPSSGID